MSTRAAIRALPTMLKVGFSEAVAYRAEMLIWVLATTMPLIMLALWSSVAASAPIGRFGQSQFTAYFLATFVVRQLTGSWASWQMNFEVRDGTLAMRLLRPVHPLLAYAVENVAAIPMRVVVAIPVALIALYTVGRETIPHDLTMWILWAVSMLGAWLLTLAVNFAIGSLSFFIESSIKVMDIWLAAFFVVSGYMIPIELFPSAMRAVVDFLPFRYQMGVPVEIMTGAYDAHAALAMVLRQWAFVGLAFLVTAFAWKRGVGRFAAYGG